MIKILKKKNILYCTILGALLLMCLLLSLFLQAPVALASEFPIPPSITDYKALPGTYVINTDDFSSTVGDKFTYMYAENQGTTFAQKYANFYSTAVGKKNISNCDLAKMIDIHLTTSSDASYVNHDSPLSISPTLPVMPTLRIQKKAYYNLNTTNLASMIASITINGIPVLTVENSAKHCTIAAGDVLTYNSFNEGSNSIQIKYRLETGLGDTIPGMDYAVYVTYTGTFYVNTTTVAPILQNAQPLKYNYLCNYDNVYISEMPSYRLFYTYNSTITELNSSTTTSIKNVVSGDGTYEFNYFNSANVKSASLVFKIDKVAPSAKLTQNNNLLTVSSSDSGCGVESLSITSNNKVQQVTNDATIEILPYCTYNLTATDFSGNSTTTSLTTSYVEIPQFGHFDLSDTFSYSYNYSYSIDKTSIVKNMTYSLIPDFEYSFCVTDAFSNSFTFNKRSPKITWKGYDNNESYTSIIEESKILSSGFKNSNFRSTSITVNNVNSTETPIFWTVANGQYNCILTDFLGNKYSQTFIAAYDTFPKNTIIGQYFEQPTLSNNFYSFASRENAIKYGIERENSTVVTMHDWNSTTTPFPGGCPIEPLDTIQPGQVYYKYKSISDEKLGIVAYFNVDLLNQALKYYAEKSLTQYYYFDKTPAPAHPNENLFTDYNIYSESVRLNPYGNLIFTISQGDFSIKMTASTPSSERTYKKAGTSFLNIIDIYGNSFDFEIILLTSAPNTLYSFTKNGEYNLLQPTISYRESIYIKINSLDDISFLIVRDAITNQRLRFSKINDDTYTISTSGAFTVIPQYNEKGDSNYLLISLSGQYKISSINHCVTQNHYFVNYSNKYAQVDFTQNEKTRQLDISVTKSLDSFVLITKIAILKSNDNKTWVTATFDDSLYQTPIDLKNFVGKTAIWNFYEFKYYKVIIYDNFGSNEVYSDIAYSRPAPTGYFSINNSPIPPSQLLNEIFFTNKNNVKFVFNNSVSAMLNSKITQAFVSPNGEDSYTINVEVGDISISSEGKYVFKLLDAVTGLFNEYIIIIDKAPPTLPIIPNKLINYDILVDFSTLLYSSPVSAEYDKNNTTIFLTQEKNIITDEGRYTLRLKDFAGNIQEYSFTIDKTAPSGSLVNCEMHGYSNLRNGNVKISKITDNFSVTDRIKIVVKFTDVYGNILFSELSTLNTSFTKDGKYEVLLEDEAGNISSLDTAITFIIDTIAPLYTSNVTGINDSITNKDVYFSWSDASIYESPISCIINKNAQNSYYIRESLIRDNGNYSIFLQDLAGNITRINFEIDKVAVSGMFYDVNGNVIPNNSIVNKPFRFAWKDTNIKCLLNNENYSKNVIIENENIYTFTLTDIAGNESVFKIQISFKIPIVEFYSDNTILENNTICTSDVLIKLLEKYTFSLSYKNNANAWVVLQNTLPDNLSCLISDTGIYKVTVTNNFFTYDYFFSVSKIFSAALFVKNDKAVTGTSATDNTIVKLKLPNSDRYTIKIMLNDKEILATFANDFLTFNVFGNYTIAISDMFGKNLQNYYVNIDNILPTLTEIFDNNKAQELTTENFHNAKFKFIFDKDIVTILVLNEEGAVLKSLANNSSNLKEVSLDANSLGLYGKYTFAFVDTAGNNMGFSFTNKKSKPLNAFDYSLIAFGSALVVSAAVGIIVYFIKSSKNGRKKFSKITKS